MKFDPNSLEDLRKKLNDLLKVYGDNNNIEFQMGRITYTDGYCNIGLKAYSTEKVGNTNVSGKNMEFLNNAARFGIPSDWYGKKVSINGVDYIVSKINTRARKFPIILDRADGTGVGAIKSTIESIKQKIL